MHAATIEAGLNEHCPGYVYRRNNSLAEIRCPVEDCSVEGSTEQHQIVTWEIQLVRSDSDNYYCNKIVLHSDGSFEWHEVHRRNNVMYTPGNLTTNSLSICERAVVIEGIDPHSGSLILYRSVYRSHRSLYHAANAVCSVHRENCNSSNSVQITVPPEGEHCFCVCRVHALQ